MYMQQVRLARSSAKLGFGFTLVELLAVIAIMVIILMAAVPVFQTLAKRDLNTVAFQLRNTLRLARQYAVAQRQWVYVVFPDERQAYTPETVAHCLRSYACVATNRETGRFEYITEWKFLPKGVYFISDPGTVFTGNIFRAATPRAPFPNNRGSSRIAPGIAFDASGQACFGGTNRIIEPCVYFTTARLYTTNSSGTGLNLASHIPGVTNSLRVRSRTGQVDFRTDQY